MIIFSSENTSRWGTEHWLAPLREHHPNTTGHHAAALVTGRRGLGHRARRRATGNHTAPEEAARPAPARPRITPAAPAAPRKPTTPRDPWQPPGTKTRQPHRIMTGNQATQDRPGSPAEPGPRPASSIGTVVPDLREPDHPTVAAAARRPGGTASGGLDRTRPAAPDPAGRRQLPRRRRPARRGNPISSWEALRATLLVGGDRRGSRPSGRRGGRPSGRRGDDRLLVRTTRRTGGRHRY